MLRVDQQRAAATVSVRDSELHRLGSDSRADAVRLRLSQSVWLLRYVTRASAPPAVSSIAVAKYTKYTPGLEPLFDDVVQRMVGHHTPRNYTINLCSKILQDLERPEHKRRCGYSALALTAELLNEYRSYLNSVISILKTPMFKAWYNKYQI